MKKIIFPSVTLILILFVSFYSSWDKKNEEDLTKTKIVSEQVEESTLPHESKTTPEKITTLENFSKDENNKISNSPKNTIDPESVVAFTDPVTGIKVISEEYTDGGNVIKTTVLLPDGTKGTISRGFSGGTDTGYNFRSHEHSYNVYDNDMLAQMADNNDRDAQMLLGQRLIRNDKTFATGEKFLNKAAKEGYTAAYFILSDMYVREKNYKSAYVYHLVLKSIDDPIGIRNTEHLMDKITKREAQEAKKIAQEIINL